MTFLDVNIGSERCSSRGSEHYGVSFFGFRDSEGKQRIARHQFALKDVPLLDPVQALARADDELAQEHKELSNADQTPQVFASAVSILRHCRKHSKLEVIHNVVARTRTPQFIIQKVGSEPLTETIVHRHAAYGQLVTRLGGITAPTETASPSSVTTPVETLYLPQPGLEEVVTNLLHTAITVRRGGITVPLRVGLTGKETLVKVDGPFTLDEF